MNKHSPLPWQENMPLFNGVISIYDDAGVVIAQFFADKEDGGFINVASNVQLVRDAVNEHDALLARAERAEAALERIKHIATNNPHSDEDWEVEWGRVYREALIALASADIGGSE